MITLQFSTQRGLESRGISWVTWCDYTHVDCVLPGGHLLGARVGADGAPHAGVQIREPHYGRFTKVLHADYDVNGKEEAYYQWLYLQLGKPYDKINILDFCLHSSRCRNWRDDSSWICSELQARASEAIGEPFLNFAIINPYKIDPRDLLLSPSITQIRVLEPQTLQILETRNFRPVFPRVQVLDFSF